MPKSLRTTETLKFSDARPQLSQLLNRVFRRERRFIIENNGIPMAALVSIDDLARLENLDAEWERDFEILDRIGAAFADQTPEEIERAVVQAIAEVRAEQRTDHVMKARAALAALGSTEIGQ